MIRLGKTTSQVADVNKQTHIRHSLQSLLLRDDLKVKKLESEIFEGNHF